MNVSMDNLVSLDIETSSDDLRGNIISIALIKCSDKSREFYREVKFTDGLFIKSRSMRVNGIDVRHIDENEDAVTLKQLDKEIVNFLDNKRYIMCGSGVSYFDRKFIEKDLPKSHRLFERPMFDINCFLMGICVAKKLDYESIKIKIQLYYKFLSAENFGVKFKNKDSADINPKDYLREIKYNMEHNAMYDARKNIFYLEECLKLFYEHETRH